jgi:hypothetical protein
MFSKIREWLRPWYNIYAVMVLSAAAGLGTYEAVPWAKLDSTGWGTVGTWAGSIGTVATLIGTIVLATADRRAARRQAHDRAVLAAAALTSRLKIIADSLQIAVEHFLDDSSRKEPVDYRMYGKVLEGHGTWTDDEILPLIVLPKHVCIRLAVIRAEILEVTRKMLNLADNFAYSWIQDTLNERQAEIVSSLIKSRDTLQFAVMECESAVKNAVRS